MGERERIMKLLAANPATLAKVDAVLNGTDGKPDKAEADCRLITYMEAAKLLGVSRPTVYRLAQTRRLEVVPLNGVNRITKRSIEAFAAGERPPTEETARLLAEQKARYAKEKKRRVGESCGEDSSDDFPFV